jgi:hypothetical protein
MPDPRTAQNVLLFVSGEPGTCADSFSATLQRTVGTAGTVGARLQFLRLDEGGQSSVTAGMDELAIKRTAWPQGMGPIGL